MFARGLAAAVVIGGTLTVPAGAAGPGTIVAPAGAVLLSPDMSIQAVVDASPAGTTYVLRAGLYRMQQVSPKDGDRFVGEPGARLNGARLLTGAVKSTRGTFVFENQTPNPGAIRHGYCQPGFPRCDRPEVLFIGDRAPRAVGRLADVAPDTWYFDETAHRIYIGEDPAERTVELADAPYAFGGSASGVRIENLIVEKYASANQRGAINDSGGGTGWMIANNEVRWNHGYGITLASGHRATGNFAHHNGQLGIGGGTSAGILVEGNEIAFNAWTGTNCDWECGGAKWGAVSDIVIRGNYAHDNGGVGLWTDESCQDVLFEDNRVENNARAGISHEIGFRAVIRNNTLRGNGAAAFRWGWHGQIQVQNAADTEVYGNRLELDPVRGGNGIAIIQQDRGPEFMVHDVYVHDNDVVMRGGHGSVAGWFADFKPAQFAGSNNRFAANRYFVYAMTPGAAFWFANEAASFTTWQASGADVSGSATLVAP